MEQILVTFGLIAAATPTVIALVTGSSKAAKWACLLGVVIANMAVCNMPGFWVVALLQSIVYPIGIAAAVILGSHKTHIIEGVGVSHARGLPALRRQSDLTQGLAETNRLAHEMNHLTGETPKQIPP